jgi:hypothetical protein
MNAKGQLLKAFESVPDAYQVPPRLRDDFLKAERYFSNQEIPFLRMGYAEEVGDVVYQLLKYSAAGHNVLHPNTQGKVFRDLGTAASVDEMYDLAFRYASDENLDSIMQDIPRGMIKESTVEALVASQYVSYISRRIRRPAEKDPGFQSQDYLMEHQLPAESAELIELVTLPAQDKVGRPLFRDMRQRINDAKAFLEEMTDMMGCRGKISGVLPILEDILKYTHSDITLDAAARYSLQKLRGRQELTFDGIEQQEVKRICKPAEYLIEAYLIS